LLASAPLADDWTFEARLENVADRDYAQVSGYNTPGRSGTFSLRWNAD
jgi:outer membrane cobalamin receptor